MTGGRFYSVASDGVRLHVRVTPRADLDRVDGLERRADDQEVLRLRVRAAPDGGKANLAVLALLAAWLDLPKSSLRLVAGREARFKTIAIAADPTLVTDRLQARTGD